jgi:putative membrane protein
MLPSALAASIHHLLAFLLVAILATELRLVRPGMSLADRRLVGKVDALYGLVALALLIIGFARVYAFEKGAEFYLDSTWFQIKITTFLLVGLFSLPPTLRFRRWGRMGDTLPDEADIRRTRGWMKAQAALLPVIPVAAALMARGY